MHSFDNTIALSEVRRQDLLHGAEAHRLAVRRRRDRSPATGRWRPLHRRTAA